LQNYKGPRNFYMGPRVFYMCPVPKSYTLTPAYIVYQTVSVDDVISIPANLFNVNVSDKPKSFIKLGVFTT